MSLLREFANVAVLVIGDVMLDEYVWGDVQRISPEAPVPVVEFRTRSHVAGGAANAAANVASLSGHALLGGVVGPDIESDMLRDELTKSDIDAHLVTSGDRPTTTKTRIIGGSQQILRIDREEKKQIAHGTESSLLEWTKRRVSSIDCVLISDYGKGVVTRRLCEVLMDLARAENKPIVVDPKGRDYSKYIGATVVTPNVMEVRLAVEPASFSSGDLEGDVRRLHSLLEGTSFLVTRGPEGVSLFRPDGSATHIPARERNVFDVTGAGDTFAATLALALAAEATLEEAAALANTAAGVVVGKVGTGTVDLSELDSELGAR
jgi:D-beta-D-heptose 7-phosphate kinase/D-beta-D-heptose 1-phosphate adenosyltransferase